MTQDQLILLFQQIKPQVLYMIAAVLAICVVVSIVKKLVKVAIVIGIVALLVAFVGIPALNNLKAGWDWYYDTDTQIVELTLGGEHNSIDVGGLRAGSKQKVRIQFQGKWVLHIEYYDTRKQFISQDITIPQFMSEPLTRVLEAQGIPVTNISQGEMDAIEGKSGLIGGLK
jgi:hypothetical protein